MKGTIFAAALALFAFAAAPLHAQNVCRPYDDYRQAIEENGGERLMLRGETPVYGPRGITRAEVYINPENRSLSYMFIRPDGNGGEIMCLGDFLPNFEFVSPTEDEGDPA